MPEMVRQSSVGRISIAARQEAVHFHFEAPGRGPQPVQRDLLGLVPVADPQALLQQVFHPQGKARRTWRGELGHVPTAANQMSVTAWMGRLQELVVDLPAVMN